MSHFIPSFDNLLDWLLIQVWPLLGGKSGYLLFRLFSYVGEESFVLLPSLVLQLRLLYELRNLFLSLSFKTFVLLFKVFEGICDVRFEAFEFFSHAFLNLIYDVSILRLV
jgi:hypothetical protein